MIDKRSAHVALWISVVLGLAGAGALVAESRLPAAAALCELGGVVSCAAVAASPFSRVAGIPLAALGLAFYAAMPLLLVRAARSTPETDPPGDVTTRAVLALYAWAALLSVALGSISVGLLRHICPFCVVLYVASFVGLWGARALAGQRVLPAVVATLGHANLALRAGLGSFAGVFVFVAGLAAVTMRPATLPERDGLLSASELASLHDLSAPAVGPDDAPVQLVVFSDFECPFCARFAESMHAVEGQLDGRVRVEFRNRPLEFHPHARGAAHVGVCAHEQGRFWEYHDAVFGRRTEMTEQTARNAALAAGLDTAALDACLASERPEARVVADEAAALALGVGGTPTFFVGPARYVGGYRQPIVSALIERETGIE